MNFVSLLLTCENNEEAQKIADTLLGQNLIACAKIIGSVDSSFLWKGAVEKGHEVLLIMDSHESRCGLIEEEVAKLHSYETFVLTAVPLAYVSKQARL